MAAAAVIILISALVGVVGLRRADASPFSLQSTLCDSSGCGLSTVAPGAGVHFQITIAVATAPVTVTDQLPPGFIATGVTCVPAASVTSLSPNVVFTVNAANATCDVNGYFASAPGGQNTVSAVDGSSTTQTSTWNSSVNVNAPLPGDLSVTKTESITQANVSTGAQTLTYTIKVKNNSNVDLFLGPMLRVEDQIRLKPMSVPLIAQYLSSTCTTGNALSHCVDTTSPTIYGASPWIRNSPGPTDFVGWRYPLVGANSPGRLKALDTMTIVATVKVDRIPGLDCIRIVGGDGLINNAHLALNMPVLGNPQGQTIYDTNASNNTSADNQLDVDTGSTTIDPACGYGYLPASPVLKITKKQLPILPPPPPSGVPWNTTVPYLITVKNISPNLTLTNLAFEDITQQGMGTPNFVAVVANSTPAGWVCLPADCSSPASTGPQQHVGFLDYHTVFKTTLRSPGPGLGPNQQLSFVVKVKYQQPDCDTYPSVAPKLILNYARVTGWTQTSTSPPSTSNVVAIAQAAEATFMGKPAQCPLKVYKTVLSPLAPAKIRFFPGSGQITVYRLLYKNLDTVPHTVGTVIDTMRISVPNYASQLPISSRYSCAPTTAGSVTGYPAGGPGWTANNIIYTQYAQQGVRIIQNVNPVVFAPGAVLRCFVQIRVYRPLPTDPYCAQSGNLDNTAIIDGSRFYNPNMPWPTANPNYSASASRPLPKCFDLVPNKTVSPLWTYPGGPQLTFGVTIFNGSPSDPIAGLGPQFTDTMVPSLMTNNYSGLSCTPTAAPCQGQWPANFPGVGSPVGTMNLNLNQLPANDTMKWGYKAYSSLGAPYPAPGGQICNEIYGRMLAPPGPQALDFFWKQPAPGNPQQTLHAKVCVPVLQVGKVLMKKIVTVDPGLSAPSIPFTITLTCSNGSLVIPASTVTLNANGSATINGIPVGSSCTTTEAALPPPHPVHGCANAGWSPPVITPNPLTATTGGTMTVTVVNHFGCLTPTATIVYNKVVNHQGNWIPPSTAQFPITLACQSGPTSTVTLLAGGTAQISVPVGLTCTTTEVVPAPIPHPVCAQLGWFPPTISPNPISPTVAGTTVVTVTNLYGCLPASTGTIVYKKSLIVDSGYTAPTTTFNLTVQCQGPNGMFGPANVTVNANGSAQVGNVPVGSTCNTTEQLPPPIHPLGTPCQTLGFFPPVITPNPLSPTTNGTMTVAVQNHYGCLVPNTPSGAVSVKKVVNNTTPLPAPAIAFAISVQCGNAAAQTFPLANGGLQNLTNLTANSTCTVTELPPPPPVMTSNGACRKAGWLPAQIAPNPVVVPVSGTVNVVVTNVYACLPLP